ncbi:MAG: DinB family protein [bacterium]
MSTLEQIRRLWQHAEWADDTLQVALEAIPETPPPDVMREYAHVLGAAEVWLARVEGRPSTTPVWPTLTLPEARALAAQVRDGYARLFAEHADEDLSRGVSYTNSAGQAFVTPLDDILLHVMLHGQYHRGKVNALLRMAGADPAPVDFISYVRGVPAATTPTGASRPAT